MVSPRAPKRFSTATRVHPAYLPRLHQRHSSMSLRPLRWLKPLLAVGVLGYGASAYLGTSQHRQREAVQRDDSERRRREELLAEQYGDRDSLEALQKAVEHYSNNNRR